MSPKAVGIIVVILVVVVGGGYLLIRPQSQQPTQTPQVYEQSSGTSTNSASQIEQVLAGYVSKLYDFNKAKYDEALKSEKLVVLYFYADWCPICKAEVPKLYEAFNELTTDKVIGFRVNYNDTETDEDEKALAREFGVAYQHTKVFLKNGERVLKSPESWEKQRYLEEINKVL